MQIPILSVDAVLAGLRTTPQGLASSEAARRAAEYGPNRIEEARREPAWLRVARQFTHFFAIILWIAAGLVFLCRDPLPPALSPGVLANPFMLWGIAFELTLIAVIVYTPFGQALFGTAALAPETWLFMLPFSAAMLALEEGRNVVVRAARKKSSSLAGNQDPADRPEDTSTS
jgi:magnesium-transporting ATPase (P-type)